MIEVTMKTSIGQWAGKPAARMRSASPMRRKISMVRALHRSILGKNSGCGFCSMRTQRMPRRPIDRQGQPDRARTDDDDLCLLHRIFRPPLSEESRGQCYCSQVAFDNPTRVSLDYDDVFTA